MTGRLRGTAIALAIVMGARPGAAQQPGSVSRNDVVRIARAFGDAFTQGDAGGLADLYSKEPGVTMVTDGKASRGWDAIRAQADVLVGSHATMEIGSVDVTPLGATAALAVASYSLRLGAQQVGTGVITFILQEAGLDLKVVHSHMSAAHVVGGSSSAAVSAGGGQTASSLSPSAQPPQAMPTTVAIANGGVAVQPLQYVSYTFTLGRQCTVTGRVEGVSGGQLDFEAWIVDADNLQNLRTNHQFRAFWQSGKVAVANIDPTVLAPGTYYLVVSNMFSSLIKKFINVNARASC